MISFRCMLMGLFLCWICSNSIGQRSQSDVEIEAYGKQTKKYISIMHTSALEVASKYVQVSRSPSLFKQKKWHSNVLSELATLSLASKQVQSIHPVPKVFKRVNLDIAALGWQMEVASATYKKGVQLENINLIHEAIMAMKDTDDIFVGLGRIGR